MAYGCWSVSLSKVFRSWRKVLRFRTFLAVSQSVFSCNRTFTACELSKNHLIQKRVVSLACQSIQSNNFGKLIWNAWNILKPTKPALRWQFYSATISNRFASMVILTKGGGFGKDFISWPVHQWFRAPHPGDPPGYLSDSTSPKPSLHLVSSRHWSSVAVRGPVLRKKNSEERHIKSKIESPAY